MGRKISLIFLICFFAAAQMASSREKDHYYNREGRFSFVIPEGWIEIPPEVLDEKLDEIRTIYRSLVQVRYDAAFQKESESYFTYPYMLVKIDKSGKITSDQMKAYLVSDKFKERLETPLKEIESSFSGLLKFGRTGELTYDRDRHMFFFIQEQDIVGAGRVKGVNATLLNRSGYVDIYFNTRSDDFDSDIISFNKIIDSFEYDEGYEYDEAEEE